MQLFPLILIPAFHTPMVWHAPNGSYADTQGKPRFQHAEASLRRTPCTPSCLEAHCLPYFQEKKTYLITVGLENNDNWFQTGHELLSPEWKLCVCLTLKPRPLSLSALSLWKVDCATLSVQAIRNWCWWLCIANFLHLSQTTPTKRADFWGAGYETNWLSLGTRGTHYAREVIKLAKFFPFKNQLVNVIVKKFDKWKHLVAIYGTYMSRQLQLGWTVQRTVPFITLLLKDCTHLFSWILCMKHFNIYQAPPTSPTKFSRGWVCVRSRYCFTNSGRVRYHLTRNTHFPEICLTLQWSFLFRSSTHRKEYTHEHTNWVCSEFDEAG